ncbi:MAG: SIMPL domain-containing protein [bacterium]
MLNNKPVLKISLVAIILILIISSAVISSSWIISSRPMYIQNNTGLDGKPVNNISVTADGKISVKPDVVQFTAGYTVTKNTISEVQSDLSEKNNNIVKSLKDQGLVDKDINTISFDMYPNYRYENGRTISDGHNGSLRISAKVRDINKAGQIIDNTVKAGANVVDSINFALDDSESAKSLARDLAGKLAKQKAEELAKSSGTELGGLIAISETNSNSNQYYYSNFSKGLSLDSASSAPTQIASGSLEITVSVSATYGIK